MISVTKGIDHGFERQRETPGDRCLVPGSRHETTVTPNCDT